MKMHEARELVEIRGMTPAEGFAEALEPYHELLGEKDAILTWYFGLALLTLLMYVIYHLISKIRGNEKNVELNNYGIRLALVGLVGYSLVFSEQVLHLKANAKWLSWYSKHEKLQLWIWWSADSAYLLYHWLFNWRYVKSTFRLPVLHKSAEFHNKKLDKIIAQREEQHVLFSPKELEDFAREMG